MRKIITITFLFFILFLLFITPKPTNAQTCDILCTNATSCPPGTVQVGSGPPKCTAGGGGIGSIPWLCCLTPTPNLTPPAGGDNCPGGECDNFTCQPGRVPYPAGSCQIFNPTQQRICCVAPTTTPATGSCSTVRQGICKSACESGETNVEDWRCPKWSPTQQIFCCVPIGMAPAYTPLGPSCDICKCEGESLENTAACPKCDSECKKCLLPKENGGIHSKGGSYTALGCIPTDFDAFIVWFLQRAIGISGGIAFLLMIFGGFKIMTSAGDPKGVQAAGEMITSAIAGLLFIIFSVFLLELIGVKILGIPGL